MKTAAAARYPRPPVGRQAARPNPMVARASGATSRAQTRQPRRAREAPQRRMLPIGVAIRQVARLVGTQAPRAGVVPAPSRVLKLTSGRAVFVPLADRRRAEERPLKSLGAVETRAAQRVQADVAGVEAVASAPQTPWLEAPQPAPKALQRIPPERPVDVATIPRRRIRASRSTEPRPAMCPQRSPKCSHLCS